MNKTEKNLLKLFVNPFLIGSWIFYIILWLFQSPRLSEVYYNSEF